MTHEQPTSENEKREIVLVFQLNEIIENFDEVDINKDVPLSGLLYHDLILSFVDPEHKAVWVWKGRGSTTRMKFLAVQLAPTVRDRYGIDYTIIAVDDGDEPPEFKKLCGLKE